jgi:Ca2+-binding EF-hand superfamily protein
MRLRIGIQGQPCSTRFHEALNQYAQSLMTLLDANGDGALDEQEARKVPPPLLLSAMTSGNPPRPVNFAFSFRILDDDDDKCVTPAELALFYRNFSDGACVQIPRLPARASGPEAALFARLDTNDDAALSAEELAAAPALLKLGMNNHDVLTPQDLSRQNVPGRERRAGRSPFDLEPPGPRPIDVDLTVEFGNGPEHPAGITLTPTHPPDAASAWRTRVSERGTVQVRHADTWIELRVAAAPERTLEQARHEWWHQFAAADRDNDGRVGSLEIQTPELQRAFALVDQNSDRTISKAEMSVYLETYLPREQAVNASRVVVAISEEGRGLFDLLDANGDGRLGLRELRAAPRAALEADRNGDGRLEAEELPQAIFVLTVYCGLTPAKLETGLATVAGPLWFQGMDRNGDGDVSQREFLGNPASFRQIDRDGDELIDLEEALQADGRFRKRPPPPESR